MNRVAKWSLALVGGFLLVSVAANFGGFGGWLELVVQAPYMALLFYGFYRVLLDGVSGREWKKTFLDLLLLFALAVFFIGYGAHFAANYVEVLMAENEFMLLIAPKVASNSEVVLYLSAIYIPTYYFDEILGHQLVYTGFFGLMVGGVLLEAWYRPEEELKSRDYAALASSSLMLTVIITVATAEGQYAIHALALTMIMASTIGAYFRRRILKKPFSLMMLLTSVMTAIYILLLAALFFDPVSVALHGLIGRVPQPSEPIRLLRQFVFLSGMFSDEAKLLLTLLL